MLSKKMKIPYKVYHLMYVSKLSCKCKRKEKKRKKRKRKQILEKQIKVKTKENKRKYIIYTITYLLVNGTKNLTRSKY